jgi:hypothetical protein
MNNPTRSFRAGIAALTFVAALPAAADIAVTVPTLGYWVVEVTNEYLGQVSGSPVDTSAIIHDLGYQAACPVNGTPIDASREPSDDMLYGATLHEAWMAGDFYGNHGGSTVVTNPYGWMVGTVYGQSDGTTGGDWLTPDLSAPRHDIYCLPANPSDYNPLLFKPGDLGQAGYHVMPGYIANPNGIFMNDAIVSPPYTAYKYRHTGSFDQESFQTLDLPIGDKVYRIVGYGVQYATPYLTGYAHYEFPYDSARDDDYFAYYFAVKTGVAVASPTRPSYVSFTPSVLYGSAETREALLPLPSDANVTARLPLPMQY